MPSGVTVTISANTEVKFQDYYKITVEEGGHIYANGTGDYPIVFKPATVNPNNKWNQIKLYHTGDNVFKHCTFECAYYPIYTLSCNDSYGGPNIFENCVFKNNYKYGAYVRSSVAEFTACEIKDNVSYGLYLYASEVDLTGNRIKNNTRGIVSRSSSDLDLFGNVIEDNSQYGLMTYYYDNTKLGSFNTAPFYYGRNTVWHNNSTEVYAYRRNPDVQLIANYIEGSGGSDLEVKNYSSNTNDIYCVYSWWGGDVLESSGLVTNINQSYSPCLFKGQTLLEEPVAKQTIQAVSAGDLEIDPYLPLGEKIDLAKQIIAEKPNKKEAVDALDLIYSILRSDFRENQLDERNIFIGYLVSLEEQYGNKELGIRALQYLILWHMLSGQDDEMITLSEKALKKISKEDGNMLIGDLAYTYLKKGWIEDAQNCTDLLKKEKDQEQWFIDQLEEDIEDARQMIEDGQLAIDRANPSVKSEYIFSEGESIMNYPNPGNPTTTVKYRLSKPGQVNIRVYNIWGQVVKVLVDEDKVEGVHEVVWDGRNTQNVSVSTGLYLIQLQTTENILTHKVTILK